MWITRRVAALSMFIVVIVVAAVAVGYIAIQRRRVPDAPRLVVTKELSVATPPTLRQREKWVASDFFDDDDLVRAGALIAEKDDEGLKQAIDSGLDVNRRGKTGMTLLYWAFASDNLSAFKMLLEAGADPDSQLTSTTYLRSTPRSFIEGDSILFTTMRSLEPRRIEFFVAALDHSDAHDPRDIAGNTLLLVCMHESVIAGVTEPILERILSRGVDLNVQDKIGYTAAMRALAWDRPDLCLKLLQAGVNPNARSVSGETVADLLARKVEESKMGAPRPGRLEMFEKLKQWLDARVDAAGVEVQVKK